MDGQRTLPPASLEFTYDWYRAFLDRLQSAGHEFRTFSDSHDSGDVILRHDVDLSLEKALTVARIEAERDVESTYCILLTSALYNPMEREHRDRIRAIGALGHEVALHFSTHEYWDADDRPDDDALEDRVAEEQEILETIMPATTDTVSFHVPPSWVLGRSFETFRNAYAPAYFDDVEYVADSGQRWRDAPPDLPQPPSTVQVLTHPGLWGEADGDFEARVDWSVAEACRHADRKSQLEFFQGGNES